ncbi:MAG: hypothetical protein OEM94_09310 [Acidimicrobiia bacterium]|nr:hypothetical protein [Acidimicrobiia bacterium]
MGTQLASTVTPLPTLDALEPGRVVGLAGSPGLGVTRLGLSLLSTAPGALAYVDARGWFCPLSAWDLGIDPGRLVVVRCPDSESWPRVVAAIAEGVKGIYAEVPAGVPDSMLRRLAALARNRRSTLLLRPLRGQLPSGISHARYEVQESHWEGADQGHGRLLRRRMVVEVSGKATGGIPRIFEIEDNGTHPLRLVPRLAAAPAGYATG